MRNTIWCVVLVAACGDSTSVAIDARPDSPDVDAADPLALTTEELAAAHTLSPLPAVPADTTNAYADNAAAARLGQMLFFDKSYAGPLVVGDTGTNGGLGKPGEAGKVSCASCHAAGSEAIDDRRSIPNATSLGTDRGTRNALGVVNSSFYKWTNWGGRFDSQWSLPMAVAENAKIMDSTRLAIAHMIYAKYRTEYNAIFEPDLDPDLDPAASNAARFPATGKPGQTNFDNMAAGDKTIINRIFANYGKALAAYVRTLVSRDAPFDRFVAGDHSALTAPQVRGLKLFISKKCIGCHSGPNFSDDEFHALASAPVTDMGRFADLPVLLASTANVNSALSDDTNTHKLDGLAAIDSMKGQFRTKSLRNVAGSGPFMHGGTLATLGDVVDFYSQGGGDVGASGVTKDTRMTPFALTAGEKADLVAFMESLSGAPVPASAIVDISK
ncbi:MAG TPA: cytochrome c peroxidase [Kofleriaceae bacterium]|nr:cytochrome c peroxidase [Kofleriaceae bacterium]